MKNSNIIIWLLGVVLIVLLCVLCADYFSDMRVLLLDGAVLMCSYSLLIYVYGGLYYDKEEFARDVPAAGVRIPALWVYVILALVGILAGYAYSISFSWQVFYQLCFLFLMTGGLLLGKASTDRLHQVADNSQQVQFSKEQLVRAVQKLRISASVSGTIDDETKERVNKLAERIGYISPSTTLEAKSLEDSLTNSINRIQDLLNGGSNADVVFAELEKAQTLLSQRLKTY